MTRNKKFLFGALTIGIIAIISGFAIHSVHKTVKDIDMFDIDWDI